ncbi:MAG: PfkB family carbohydrate kinase, partial [Candidatus Micrarchaeota archaeon]|nr:PfkB family carbohydrate kinase [Candidatus Micrarchaeota archaeon]
AHSLGLHPAICVTSITSQNTRRLFARQDASLSAVSSQLDSVFSDMTISAVKIGMLANGKTADAIHAKLAQYKAKNIVLDPVLSVQPDSSPLYAGSLNSILKLVSISSIVTPNAGELSKITGVNVVDVASASKAASVLIQKGAKNVLVKGISHRGSRVDVLFPGKKIFIRKQFAGGTHGGGCVLSSAIACYLAMGEKPAKAVEFAEKFSHDSLLCRSKIGRGVMAAQPKNTERAEVIKKLAEAVSLLESDGKFASLIPEIGTNIGYATKDAKNANDVAAVVGRIRNAMGVPASLGKVAFGASSHIARVIISARKKDSSIRSAIDIRYSPKLVKKCKKLGLSVSSFSRKEEPKKSKSREGSSLVWGVVNSKTSEVLVDLGGEGKEPTIFILGSEPVKVAMLAVLLARG